MYIVFEKPVTLDSYSDYIYNDGGKTCISTCWCREVVGGVMRHATQNLSVEDLTGNTVSIFGICSHESNQGYENSRWRIPYKGNPNLDREMLRWFLYTVLLCTEALHGIAPKYNTNLSDLIEPLSDKVGMWQNEPPEYLREGLDKYRTEGRGGIYGVPAELLKNPPILSLLLYLPRLCVSLNKNRARLWQTRDMVDEPKYHWVLPRAFESIFTQFAFPTNFTVFGGAELWTMYYILTREPKESKILFEDYIRRRSGFRDAIGALYSQETCPKGIKQFYLDYKTRGAFALVAPKRIYY